MRNIDGSYSFRLFWELDKINSQDHLGREIKILDSYGIFSKNSKCGSSPTEFSMTDGRGSTDSGEVFFFFFFFFFRPMEISDRR
jgi:hypothetical protein